MKRRTPSSRRLLAPRAFRPSLLALEDRALLSGSGYDYGSGGASLPSGLGADINFINNPTDVAIRDFPWESLIISGGAPWNALRPSDFTSQNPPDKTDVLSYGALTRTIVTHFSATGSSSGGGGGSWESSYVEHILITTTSSDVDSSGHNVDQTSSHSYDLSWDGSSDSSGTTTYTVKEDVSDTGSVDVTGGSLTRHQGSTYESHLTANGTEDSSGTITGDFTFKGSTENSLTFNDAGGDAASSGLDYTLNYTASTDETLSGSGNLVPDSSNQGTIEIDSSGVGDIALTDATGGFLGYSCQDGATVTSTYSGGQSSSPNPPTTGTIDPTVPKTKLAVPAGKNVVYVIDKGDRGWFDWSQANRDSYAATHNIDPKKTPNGGVANGSQILAALAPPNNNFVYAYGMRQIVGDLTVVQAQNGSIDVLVLGDHGYPGGQTLGNDPMEPVGARTDGTKLQADRLDAIAGFVRQGGTLVVTGCTIFSTQQSINAWQAYATTKNITIMGTASDTSISPNNYTGVWVTLVPGGTAPQLSNP